MLARTLLTRGVCAALFAAAAIGCEAEIEPAEPSGDTEPDWGTVSGGVAVYRGIPYAAPPVGELRWREPQPALASPESYAAKTFANDCMQVRTQIGTLPQGNLPAEDCLAVNVWRAADLPADARLPVLVWIYGGAYVNGSSSTPLFDGSAFVDYGLVFVSFNYRLGRFGYFAHPALTRADEGPLGNYGYMDQIAALEWVRDNITAFNGDPELVTVMGESAGGASIIDLLSAPQAAGLFHRAIVLSGGGRYFLGGLTLEQAEPTGTAFAESQGISGDDSDALTELRRLYAEDVRGDLDFETLAAESDSYAGGPIIDGQIVRGTADEMFHSGGPASMPILIGTTSEDLSTSSAASKDELFATFGEYEEDARETYDPDGTRSLQELNQEVGADRSMHEPARFVAQRMTAMGSPVWLYRFSYVAEEMRPEWSGAPHASELPYLFDTLDLGYEDVTDRDRAAGLDFRSYIASFASSGAPSNPDMPEWPAYDPDEFAIMNFSPDDGPVLEIDPWKARLDVAEETAEEPWEEAGDDEPSGPTEP
ncbi:MAG TPA: carboxylesterase family protein [Polyangiaceae bacterium]|nr:carboxylesterase family protein [Polyangiaceae bacterium]